MGRLGPTFGIGGRLAPLGFDLGFEVSSLLYFHTASIVIDGGLYPAFFGFWSVGNVVVVCECSSCNRPAYLARRARVFKSEVTMS